jgi:hypothetical protein
VSSCGAFPDVPHSADELQPCCQSRVQCVSYCVSSCGAFPDVPHSADALQPCCPSRVQCASYCVSSCGAFPDVPHCADALQPCCPTISYTGESRFRREIRGQFRTNFTESKYTDFHYKSLNFRWQCVFCNEVHDYPRNATILHRQAPPFAKTRTFYFRVVYQRTVGHFRDW